MRKLIKEKKMDKIVDKDIFDFLKVACFGNYSDPVKTASDSAYKDMCRTLRFKDTPYSVRHELRTEITQMLNVEIDKLPSIKSQEEFDEWHFILSKNIRKKYLENNISFTYGQAQKWINMTIKYLYILEAQTFDGVFGFLHIPIDNYILAAVNKQFGIKYPDIPWSRWDDYVNIYLDFQNKIRSKVTDIEPLRWEFRNWIKYAK